MKRRAGWIRIREILVALMLALVAGTAFAAPYFVSSGSMQPSLLIGDHMVAEPFAYGYSTADLPFGDRLPRGGRLWGSVPKRGDVVVFRSPSEPGTSWVKRVIGLPGDRIALIAGYVVLNGRVVPWTDRGVGREELADGSVVPARRFTEDLPGGVAHSILKVLAHGPVDEMSELRVPEGRLFVMGDNRDNSADSRFSVAQGGVGLLPLWNLQGRVRLVAASRDIDAPGAGPAAWMASVRPERMLLLVR